MKPMQHRSVTQLLLALVFAFGMASGSARAQEKVNDPFEPLNRGFFFFNEIFDAVITTPVTSIYKAIIPDPVRRSIGGVFGNLDDLYSGVNHGLQGKGKQAGTDFSRVLINTTIGLGGLFDGQIKIRLWCDLGCMGCWRGALSCAACDGSILCA